MTRTEDYVNLCCIYNNLETSRCGIIHLLDGLNYLKGWESPYISDLDQVVSLCKQLLRSIMDTQSGIIDMIEDIDKDVSA